MTAGTPPPLVAPVSLPASNFGPSEREAAEVSLSLREVGRQGLDLICVTPVLHVLEYARLYRLAAACRQASPALEIVLWVRSPLGDLSSFDGLPVDRVERLPPAGELGPTGFPGAPEGGRALLIGGAQGQAEHLRAALGARFVGERPLGFESRAQNSPEYRAASERFLAALLAETPRWRRSDGATDLLELPPRPRLLVHQARGHVGDALWLTPLLQAIHRRFEGARVTVVGTARAEAALASSPWIEGFWGCELEASADHRREIAERTARASFDAAIFGFGRHPASSWLLGEAARAGVPWRINLEYFDPDLDSLRAHADATHEAWFFWGTLASPEILLHALDPFAGLDGSDGSDGSAGSDGTEVSAPAAYDAKVEFPVSAGAERQAGAVLEESGVREGPFVILTPGGDSSIRWPVARFAALARRLVERFGLTVLIEGSARERELTESVAEQALAGRRATGSCGRIVARQDSLAELAALIARARLLVSNDSAPIHLAEASGTPTLYLAQQEKLIHSHPRGEACWALYDDLDNDPAQITVDQAWGAVREMVDGGWVSLAG